MFHHANVYDQEKVYSNSQLENLNQDLEDLSRVDIKDRAVSLIEEKNIIEEKIEKGELDPENSSSGPIIRLSNIYSELNLIPCCQCTTDHGVKGRYI